MRFLIKTFDGRVTSMLKILDFEIDVRLVVYY